MPKVVALFIDALSSDYIDERRTPHLHALSRRHGVAALEPLFAFQGVAVSMFTGAPPSSHGIWTDFKTSRTRDVGRIDPFYRLIPLVPAGMPRKGVQMLYERYLKGARVTPHAIPPRLRPYFTPALKKGLTADGAVAGHPTVFETARAAGRTVYARGLSGGPQDPLIEGMPRIAARDEDLVLLKVNILDELGHAHDVSRLDRELKRIDRKVHEAIEAVPDKEVVVFSDHGMTPVTGVIDAQALVKAAAPRAVPGRDFIPFYNSTAATFRWFDTAVRDRVHEAVAAAPHMRLLSDKDKERLHLGAAIGEYADDVLVTLDGRIIAPDFYTPEARRGMHGFAEPSKERAVLLHASRDVHAAGTMWDVAPTLWALMGLPAPASCTGRALCG